MILAGQWTAFTFGIIATTSVIVFFRGVEVVGHHAPKPASISEGKKGEQVDAHDDETGMPFEENDVGNVRHGDSDVTGTTPQVSSSPRQMDKLGV